jgi:hypothetical protein
MKSTAAPANAGQADRTGVSPAPPLPDVNAETHPYPRVQALLDEAVSFNLFAQPDPRPEGGVWTLTHYAPDDYFGIQGGYGVVVRSGLHRFETTLDPGQESRVRQGIGPRGGSLRSRWLISTDAMEWSPGKEPPPAILDPWRSQPFALLDFEVEIGERGDGFTGYGVGRTFPITVDGRPRLLAAAVGTALQGRGRLQGMEGTFALNGELTEELGFRGDLTVRAPDPFGKVRTEREIPALAAGVGLAGDEGSYLVLRGEKEHREVRTEYGPAPGPGLVSLVTPAMMRSGAYPFSEAGRGGLRARMEVGSVVARLQANVVLDLFAPPGTTASPNDFTTHNVYTFLDASGAAIGTIEAQVVVGKSFQLSFPGAPDQAAMRYGGFGPVLGGTGRFAGARGMVSLNSAIGVAPHALSMINVIRLVDPAGRFRVAAGAAGACAS